MQFLNPTTWMYTDGLKKNKTKQPQLKPQFADVFFPLGFIRLVGNAS